MRSILLAGSIGLFACGGGGETGGDDGGMGAPDLASGGFTPAPHAAWPKFSTSDNTVLSPMTLVSIVAQNDGVGGSFLDFGDRLAQSSWWKTVAPEYMLGSATNVRVTGPAMTKNVTQDDIVAYINMLIQAKAAPAPNGNTMYMVYLPAGIVEIAPDGTLNTNCQIWEGFHLPFGNKGDNWAFAQRCYGDGQMGIDDATNTGSHEVYEGATDPTGNGWTLSIPSATPWTGEIWDSAGYGALVELADLCGGTTFREGGFDYQRVWSDAAAAKGGDPCVPAIAEPYYNVTADGWYQVTAGSTVQITLTGWSTAQMGDWYLDHAEIGATGGTWKESLSSSRSFKYQGYVYPALNNAETATLKVTAPANAQSGSYDTIMVFSSAEQMSPASDLYHVWPVGVYVP